MKNQIFWGSFIHCQSRDELEYLHNIAVFVDGSSGRIAAIEPQCDVQRAKRDVLPRLGWNPFDVSVTACRPGQFFFPGFIGGQDFCYFAFISIILQALSPPVSILIESQS